MRKQGLDYGSDTQPKVTRSKCFQKLRFCKGIFLQQSNKPESMTSFHSLVTLQTTQVFQKKAESFQKQPQVYEAAIHRLPAKKFSRSNFGWMLSKGDSILKHNFHDRVEHLLSISPSEYVRRDKERKSKEQGLRSCIQSLTSLLEKALNNDTLEIQDMSKDDIKRSINTLKENFENQLNNDYQLSEFPSPSLQSLIAQSTARNALRDSLSPNLISSIYRASHLRISNSNFDNRSQKRREMKERKSRKGSNLSLKSSDSLDELFRKVSNEFFRDEKMEKIEPRPVSAC
ncbi:uncharacterized protein LOC115874753 isoform X2 [Sitophilus oryzae]|uniref:Uncharacterized protein LOC115874753 isoform X2 n=1 Tax=Sitophilus oryzae TaxID=7048 RepID=A0A6J2X3V2_SITOR|nr:uncharacterized protein LOC115874753 isoform X2 [Sitophilus oryzae]